VHECQHRADDSTAQREHAKCAETSHGNKPNCCRMALSRIR